MLDSKRPVPELGGEALRETLRQVLESVWKDLVNGTVSVGVTGLIKCWFPSLGLYQYLWADPLLATTQQWLTHRRIRLQNYTGTCR